MIWLRSAVSRRPQRSLLGPEADRRLLGQAEPEATASVVATATAREDDDDPPVPAHRAVDSRTIRYMQRLELRRHREASATRVQPSEPNRAVSVGRRERSGEDN